MNFHQKSLTITSWSTPETIARLASGAYNDVSYRDLMYAAGHIVITQTSDSNKVGTETTIISNNNNQEIGKISPQERIQKYQEIEKKYFQVILSHLYEVDYKWSIKKPVSESFMPDMVIDIEHEGYTRWFFEFKAALSDKSIATPPVSHSYGQCALMELESTDKVTIAVNTPSYYEQFFTIPPKSLRANLYIMLVDLEKEKILKEEKLCSYFSE